MVDKQEALCILKVLRMSFRPFFLLGSGISVITLSGIACLLWILGFKQYRLKIAAIPSRSHDIEAAPPIGVPPLV
jgi:uncharacterized protein involved in response to NO